MGKLQRLKRDTVRQIIGTIDYTVELTCEHRVRVTNDQLRGPERVWCNQCTDDAPHAQASPKGPLQLVQSHYQDRDGYWEHLACGHRRSASNYPPKPGQRRRCPECLQGAE